MSSDTTSILDLPTDPAGGGSNISLSANENVNISASSLQNNASVTLDQTTISQIVNGLQQASSSGVTQLPSRDIPQNTNTITQDPYIQPNYIPPANNSHDYITEYQSSDEMIHQYNKGKQQNDSLDELYNEIQIPLLLAVLYFLFQLPFFKKTLFTYFPMIFMKDGNYNIYGFVFTSILYGVLFYILNKSIIHFSRF